jgi:octaheme c-type cytochrome (tetrathionate reductase family)
MVEWRTQDGGWRHRRVGLRRGLLTALAASLSLATAGVESRTLPRKQPTADHRQFDVLKQEFKSGPEVTAACLGCHTEAAKQMMATTHWTWRARVGGAEADTDHWIGKGAGVINNFCLGVSANEPRCTSCHVGYGWEDKSFDFANEVHVDCLVCHDTTGSYHKFPTDAGHPNYVAKEWPKGSGKIVPPPDLGHVARHVGRTSRATCGSCHFFGGGGEGVKHGVMDASLVSPDRAVDVHMSPQGADLICADCHTTVNHRIAGRYYDQPAYEDRALVMRGVPQSVLGCETCHGDRPHPHHAKLNDHTDKVSCQACHIPLLAPAKPTKMWWDWSQAGRFDAAGNPLVEIARAATGDSVAARAIAGAAVPEVVVYDGTKGSFQWAWKAVPEYADRQCESDGHGLGGIPDGCDRATPPGSGPAESSSSHSPMKSALECIPCFVSQALNVARLATADAQVHERVLREVLRASSEADLSQSPCSPEFQGRFAHASLILAKGQANFESLDGCGQEIYFLFKVKCPVVARHINHPVGSLVLHRNVPTAATRGSARTPHETQDPNSTTGVCL